MKNFIYSYLSNKRAGYNKRAGWDFCTKLLNEQGKNVSNKRVGWIFSEKFANEQG